MKINNSNSNSKILKIDGKAALRRNADRSQK